MAAAHLNLRHELELPAQSPHCAGVRFQSTPPPAVLAPRVVEDRTTISFRAGSTRICSTERFIKTNKILGYSVREKRAGWGAEYPEEKRNGEWEYRVFRADETANPDTNYDNCFGCHKSQASQEYMFTFDNLKVASH